MLYIFLKYIVICTVNMIWIFFENLHSRKLLDIFITFQQYSTINISYDILYDNSILYIHYQENI